MSQANRMQLPSQRFSIPVACRFCRKTFVDHGRFWLHLIVYCRKNPDWTKDPMQSRENQKDDSDASKGLPGGWK